jgi:hypothetical protein
MNLLVSIHPFIYQDDLLIVIIQFLLSLSLGPIVILIKQKAKTSLSKSIMRNTGLNAKQNKRLFK